MGYWMNEILKNADILLPKDGIDLQKWSVIACDQYTSEPEYWDSVETFVGENPSALHMIYPEIYLEEGEDRIGKINETMRGYLANGLFQKLPSSYVYVERRTLNGKIRRGLVGRVDLEEYDYSRDSKAKIRATEGTVLERIPPRVKIRKDAPLESPHIMLFADDPDNLLLGSAERAKGDKLYDFELMRGGGQIRGYRIGADNQQGIAEALKTLADPDRFYQKYGTKDVMLFAVGDGNHSLATAKECWNQLKASLPEQERQNHPARFALVEIVNLYDPSIVFEGIHRVVFDCDPEQLLRELEAYCKPDGGDVHTITCCMGGRQFALQIPKSLDVLAVGALQKFLDDYLARHAGRIDYIHGEGAVQKLSEKKNSIGFLLPAIEKEAFFESIVQGGPLPRKTFSMGDADEKRYYLECRTLFREKA